MSASVNTDDFDVVTRFNSIINPNTRTTYIDNNNGVFVATLANPRNNNTAKQIFVSNSNVQIDISTRNGLICIEQGITEFTLIYGSNKWSVVDGQRFNFIADRQYVDVFREELSSGVGGSFAISENYLVEGRPRSQTTRTGEVIVYTRESTRLIRQQRIIPPTGYIINPLALGVNPEETGHFGHKIIMNNEENLLFIAAPFLDLEDNTNRQGTLFIYALSNSEWLLTDVISDFEEFSSFNFAINASGRTIAILSSSNTSLPDRIISPAERSILRVYQTSQLSDRLTDLLWGVTLERIIDNSVRDIKISDTGDIIVFSYIDGGGQSFVGAFFADNEIFNTTPVISPNLTLGDNVYGYDINIDNNGKGIIMAQNTNTGSGDYGNCSFRFFDFDVPTQTLGPFDPTEFTSTIDINTSSQIIQKLYVAEDWNNLVIISNRLVVSNGVVGENITGYQIIHWAIDSSTNSANFVKTISPITSLFRRTEFFDRMNAVPQPDPPFSNSINFTYYNELLKSIFEAHGGNQQFYEQTITNGSLNAIINFGTFNNTNMRRLLDTYFFTSGLEAVRLSSVVERFQDSFNPTTPEESLEFLTALFNRIRINVIEVIGFISYDTSAQSQANTAILQNYVFPFAMTRDLTSFVLGVESYRTEQFSGCFSVHS